MGGSYSLFIRRRFTLIYADYMLYVFHKLYILTAMAALHHLPPLAFAPALHPHRKRGQLDEIQEGGRRVQERMGGRIAFHY